MQANEPRSAKKLDANTVSAIGNLRLGLSGVSFKANVIKKSQVRAVTSKDGNPLLVCDVTLSDGTGQIPLAIWNNQIDTVSQGDVVQIQNESEKLQGRNPTYSGQENWPYDSTRTPNPNRRLAASPVRF